MELSDLAAQLLTELSLPSVRRQPPLLVGLFGLPGAGKTETAHQLAAHASAMVLSTDVVRLRYKLPGGAQAQQLIFEAARYLLQQQISVIFDGIYLGRSNRAEFRVFARQNRAECRFIHATAADSVIRARLQHRLEHPTLTRQNGKYVITAEHFDRIAGYLEEPIEEEDVLTVDTSREVNATQLARICDWMMSGANL